MSDPTWASSTLVDGFEATVWVQAAGVTATPGDSDMLAYATEANVEIAGERTERGPWLNYNKIRRTGAGVAFSGSANIDWRKAADTVRALIVTRAIAQTRLKFTVLSHTSGDKWVMDEAFVDATIAIAASEGVTGEFSWESDTCVYTAATA